MFKDKISLKGLRSCLRKFDEGVRYAESGRWSIGKGGYDLAFQIYCKDSTGYKIPIIDCIQDTWDINGWLENNCLPEAEYKRVAKVIMDEYSNVKLSKEEARTISLF